MASKRGGLLTLKDMTAGSGCTPRTVRYYEREGLLQAARSSGGHRLFPPGELDRLNFILALREAGWSLEEITALLAVREQTRPDRDACRTLATMVSGHIAQLEQKISLLNRLRDDLQATRQALAVCDECTVSPGDAVVCESCTRLPGLAALPQGFRNSWRGAEARSALPRPRSLHVVDR